MIDAIRQGFFGAFNRLTMLFWVLLVPMLAFAGPFGTYGDQSFWVRLVYWGLIIVVSSIMGHICASVSRSRVGNTQPFRQDVVTTGLMGATFGPMACVIIGVFNGREAVFNFGVAAVLLSVMAVTAAVCLTRRVLPGYEPTTYLNIWPRTMPPRLMQRLPPDEAGPIIRLHVRDHFVDVVSPASTHSLRMRFGDAIAEMDTVEGYATHRSHWVAKEAIAGHARENGKTFIVLKNGDRIPVSRSYRPALQEAGLL